MIIYSIFLLIRFAVLLVRLSCWMIALEVYHFLEFFSLLSWSNSAKHSFIQILHQLQKETFLILGYFYIKETSWLIVDKPADFRFKINSHNLGSRNFLVKLDKYLDSFYVILIFCKDISWLI